jgi:hypothetical protein
VARAKLDEQSVLVGCGVYLADAPKAARPGRKMTASELVTLVREGAAILEQQGEKAYAEFRKKESKWFRDDTYFFVWTADGTRAFHAAQPASEGRDASGMKDVLGRPIGKMILEVGAGPSGEGWVHYMYPEPGGIFPAWKSTFVKRVRFPSGKLYLVGCGIYNMQMDKAFIEDVVNRAATLIAEKGKEAFGRLRDRTGPFVFMDTYVFVDSADGTELVNPAQPSLEGKNLLGLRDVRGKAVVQDEIALAMKEGSAWQEYYWYKPGSNAPARKATYVRKVQAGRDAYIVGSGIYLEYEAVSTFGMPPHLPVMAGERADAGAIICRNLGAGVSNSGWPSQCMKTFSNDWSCGSDASTHDSASASRRTTSRSSARASTSFTPKTGIPSIRSSGMR